uniref:Vps72/YL1 C-terminal domain-containing protein n=1 Tax=Opuntia streptacantha TaxID=393608 RepID=A0A7C9CL41_OPUST
MESSKDEEQRSFLDRTSRATRGKRMNKLLDEEVEEDEAFWNQDALREEENDDEYEEEPEVADEFDSDFDEDEPEPDDEEAENDAVDRERRPKKRLIFPGKQIPKKKKKKKDISKLEESLNDDNRRELSKSDDSSEEEKNSEQPATPDQGEVRDEAEGERTVRKSTRTAVIVRQAERDAIRAALQATMKPIKRKKEGEEKRMTQEEMLLEAAQTEIMNLRNLERVLAREEEVKKRAIVHKPEYTGPQIRYFSKNGKSYIEFNNGASFDSDISTKLVPYPQKTVCAVTGLPAKYRDPKTGLPYATKEAFQIIRKRCSDEHSSGRGMMAMGNLYDSIIGQGFSEKRKRLSVPPEKGASDPRYLRRFCRISAADNLVSD